MRSKSKIYFYEENCGSLIEFNLISGDFKNMVKTSIYKGCSCRQITLSSNEKYLGLNCENNSILIFNTVNNHFDFQNPLRLTGFIGDFIRNIEFLDDNRVVTITENGILSMCVFNFEKRIGKILKFFKMNLNLEEEISCMAVSKDSRFIAVSSSYNWKNSKLYLFKVEDHYELKLKKKRDLSNEKYSQEELSFFQDLRMDYSIKGNPVILAFQYDADNLVIPFYYDDKDLCYLSEPRVFHSNIFCKVSFREFSGGCLWSIDKNGTIKRLSMTSI